MKIEVVGSKSCMPCSILRKRLTAEGFKFESLDKNDSRGKEIVEKAIELGAKSYPILVIDGEIVAHGKYAVKYKIKST